MAGAPQERWANQAEYWLSCLGYAVGMGNIWRFPYLCYRNGGGAFLVPYFLTQILCGIPMVYLETTLGQFASAGCISVFKLNPLFKGAGYAVVVLNVIAVLYFASIMSYGMLYIIHSFSSPLPWQYCNNTWNTHRCREITQDTISLGSNVSSVTPEDEFFHIGLLRKSPSLYDIGSIVWPVFWCNVLCWILVYFCICNGVKSVGKVHTHKYTSEEPLCSAFHSNSFSILYLTVLFPYLVLAILLVRGLTLPGAWQGIKFYILPEWGHLANPKVWADAATQICFSLGPGWGGLVAMASFNRFNFRNLKSSIIIPLINSGTTIWGGFVVFSILGFTAHRAGIPVGEVATAGPGLAFVTYPTAVTMMPIPNFWAVMFFAMLFFLGIDTMFVTIESVIAGVLDELPALRTRKKAVTAAVCVILFCASIVCNTEGGHHIIGLLDSHVAIACVPAVCLLELVAAVYTYGPGRLAEDVAFMTGRRLHPIWLPIWRYVVPTVILLVTFYALCEATSPLGWTVALISVVFIPIHAIIVIRKAKGPILKRIHVACRPSIEWSPADPAVKQQWIAARTESETFQGVINLETL